MEERRESLTSGASSLAGFLAGVLVSVFSKTLVLLTGIAIVAIQVSLPLLNFHEKERVTHGIYQGGLS